MSDCFDCEEDYPYDDGYDQNDQMYGSDGYAEDMEEISSVLNRNLSQIVKQKQGDDFLKLEKQQSDNIQSKHIKNEFGQSFILSSEVYFQMMLKVKREAMELICRSQNDSLLILHEFGWSINRLRDKYFENQDRVFANLGFTDEEKLDIPEKSTMFVALTDQVCELCYCESEFVGQCRQGHLFCKECWTQFIKQQLNEKKPFMKCMQDGCSSYLRHSFILEALTDNNNLLETYKKFLGMSYVEENKNIKYCPAAGCVYAGERMEGDINLTSMKCLCGTMFCFKCNQLSHYPSSCKQYTEFNEMLNRDDANLLWIVKNAKLCPYCSRAVERSMGCNFIRCAAPCNKSFCYVCEKPWDDESDGTHHRSKHMNCNTKFEESESDSAASEKDKTQKMLERVSFYVGKFKECARSCDLIRKNRLDMAEATRVILSEKLKVQRIDSQFFVDAFDILLEARVTLQWSYCFAFFFTETQKKSKELFEDLLIQFAMISEKLAILLSTDLANYTKIIKATNFSDNFSPEILEKFQSLKHKITSLSSSVKTSSQTLLFEVESGSVIID